MKTLYKYDSRGKERYWKVIADGDQVITYAGIVGGKEITNNTTCKGKNIGKSNETTAEEQAILQAQSKWNAKKDRDDMNPDIEFSGLQMRPMLAHDFNKVSHRVNWADVVVQPKLDGVRLLAGDRYEHINEHELLTRKGDNYHIPHLIEPTTRLLEIVRELNPNVISLDGEAYIHGLPLPTILSYARAYKKGLTEQLQFYVFDLVVKDIPNSERYALLYKAMELYKTAYPECNVFSLVPTFNCLESDLDIMHGSFITNGYEGIIIRHRSGLYVSGRSADLFKYKKFKDCEVLIRDVWLDNNQNAMLTCELKNGLSCGVTPKRSHVERKAMYEHRDDLIGKWITVKYFDVTPDGNLQFPVGMAIRECDENGEPIV